MPIVQAVMASASVKLPDGRNDKALSKRIEEAMAQAVTDTMSKGVKDPHKIKAAMMAARLQILDRR